MGSRPHHISPNALPPDAEPIGPDASDLLARLRRAKSVVDHGAALKRSRRRYEDDPGADPTPDNRLTWDYRQSWYRRPGVAGRVLP